MKLSFSTRGWADLSWDTLLDISQEMKFTGVEVYNLWKFPALTDRAVPSTPTGWPPRCASSGIRRSPSPAWTPPWI